MVLRLSSQTNFAPALTHWIGDSRQVWMRGGESPPSAWEVTEVFGKVNSVAMLQWYGYPCVLGITIPKTLVIWASPSHITLAIWVRVRLTRYAHITRGDLTEGFLVLGFGNGDTQNAGMPTSLSQRIRANSARERVWFGLVLFHDPLLFLRFAFAKNCSRSEWRKPCGHLAFTCGITKTHKRL